MAKVHNANSSSYAVVETRVGSAGAGGAMLGSSGTLDGWGVVNGLTVGAGTTTQDIGFRVGSALSGQANGPAVIIKSSGKVGIGTKTPAEKLDVQGNIAASGDVVAVGALSGAALSTSGTVSAGGSGDNCFAGKVGVGMAIGPAVRLHVKGDRIRLESPVDGRLVDLRTDGDHCDLQSGGQPLYINAGASAQNTAINPDAGKVAIGTSEVDDTAVLRVAGDVKVDGSLRVGGRVAVDSSGYALYG